MLNPHNITNLIFLEIQLHWLYSNAIILDTFYQIFEKKQNYVL